MQKIYSLLRSNKQSGPYSLEELLQLNLKPFDLVWVEGKSAGWSYPTEIEALKMYVSEAPKPITKKETAANSVEPTSPPVISTNEKIIRSRPTSQHIYISFPAGKQIVSDDVTVKYPINYSDESPEAKLERKAQELKNKIQAFAEKKNTPKADNEIDTKYSRSLDDIKEEYSSWLSQQRKKRKYFPLKYIVPAVIVSILFIATYYFFPFFFDNEQKQPTVLATQNIDTTLPGTNNSLPEEESIPPKEKRYKANKLSPKIQEKISSARPERIYTSEEIDKVDAYLDSFNKASEKQNIEDADIAHQQTAIKSDGTRQNTKRNSDPVTTQISQTDNDSTPFAELLKLSESTGSGTPHLNLYNNSNKYIKFVAVDVHYYKANQQLLKKKTFYFNDIPPKSSARLYLPQEKNAASVKYQMGLISTDNGLYYASQ
jgi:hypothetical protein